LRAAVGGTNVYGEMLVKSLKLILLAGAALTAPFATAAVAQTAPAAATAQTEGQRLAALFAADDEGSLKRNPLNALFRGDMRYADRFGDFISDEYFANEKKAAEANLKIMKRIDRKTRTPTTNSACTRSHPGQI